MDQHRPEPLTPSVFPALRRHACLKDGTDIFNQLGRTNAEIADVAGHHVNTVAKKVRGQRGQYKIIHDIFTAFNVISDNQFSRSKHVLYQDDDGIFQEDPSLGGCLFFPRLRRVMLSGDKLKVIGDEVGVKTAFVEHMKAGRPVAEDIVRAYFKGVRRYLGVDELGTEAEELFR